jgi:hypothetical protein
VAKEAAKAAVEVLKEKSINYTINEVEDNINLFKERGQKLAELLKVATIAQLAGPRFNKIEQEGQEGLDL